MKGLFATVFCAALLFTTSAKTENAVTEFNRKVIGFYRWVDDVVVDVTLNERKVVIRVKNTWNDPAPEAYRHAILIYVPCGRFETEVRRLENLEVDVLLEDSKAEQRASATGGFPGGKFCDTIDERVEHLIRILK